VSIEGDAGKDLSLSADDAENVTGGRMMKKQKKAQKTAAHPAPTHSAGLPTTYSDEPAVDPVADEEGV
jgi:hypothetical protein